MTGDYEPVRRKRVYEPALPDDGLRVLFTTYWPRGVRHEAVDEWVRATGLREGFTSGGTSGQGCP